MCVYVCYFRALSLVSLTLCVRVCEHVMVQFMEQGQQHSVLCLFSSIKQIFTSTLLFTTQLFTLTPYLFTSQA